MTTYIAFLRAINLGAEAEVPEGRDPRGGRGGRDERGGDLHQHRQRPLRTALRSRARIEEALERAFLADRGFEVPTIVFTPPSCARSPTRRRRSGTPAGTTCRCSRRSPAPPRCGRSRRAARPSEVARVGGRAVHLLLGENYHEATLTNAVVEKHLGVATNRNLTVIATLAEKWGADLTGRGDRHPTDAGVTSDTPEPLAAGPRRVRTVPAHSAAIHVDQIRDPDDHTRPCRPCAGRRRPDRGGAVAPGGARRWRGARRRRLRRQPAAPPSTGERGAPRRRSVRVTVLGTTDLHGNVFNWDYYKNAEYDDAAHNDIGLAKVATLVKARARADRHGEPLLTSTPATPSRAPRWPTTTPRSSRSPPAASTRWPRAMNLVGLRRRRARQPRVQLRHRRCCAPSSRSWTSRCSAPTRSTRRPSARCSRRTSSRSSRSPAGRDAQGRHPRPDQPRHRDLGQGQRRGQDGVPRPGRAGQEVRARAEGARLRPGRDLRPLRRGHLLVVRRRAALPGERRDAGGRSRCPTSTRSWSATRTRRSRSAS